MVAPNLDSNPTPDAGIDGNAMFKDLLRALWSRRWLVLAIVVLTTVAGWLWTARQPKIYEAAATLEYDPTPPRPLGRDIDDSSGDDYWLAQEFFATQNQVITSRAVAERVVRNLGLQNDPSFFGIAEAERRTFRGVPVREAATMVQGMVRVEAVDGTRLIRVVVDDTNPRRAANLANAIANAYIEKTLEDRASATVTALEFLGGQLDHLRQELEESELALHRFKEEHNVLSVSMEDRQNRVAADIEAFSTALTAARIQRIELAARATRLRESVQAGRPVDEIAPAFVERETIASLQERLNERVAERTSLGTRYGVNHPRIAELDTEIEQIRAQLSREIDAAVRAQDAQAREVARIEGDLRHALDEANQAGLQLNLREIEYQRLNRQRENNSKLYGLVLERAAETDLTRMLRTTFVRLVDEALVPGGPIRPVFASNVMGAAALGVVLAFLAAFALDRIDGTVKSLSDVEALGTSVLGVVPAIAEEEAPEGSSRRARRQRRGQAETNASSRRRALTTHAMPRSAAAECMRTVRTNLVFMSADSPFRTLLVTSASPGDGKTTVAVNLAISLAQSGKRTVMIDTDLRRPRLHRMFEVPSDVGVTSVLVHERTLDEATKSTEVPNLSVIPCGPIPPNPAELLHTHAFQQLVEDCKARFDIVVLDSPPLGAVTDPAVIATGVDGVVLVVRGHKTTRDALRAAHRKLRDVSAHIVGAVVNGVDPTTNEYGYGGYYQYYAQESTPEAANEGRAGTAA